MEKQDNCVSYHDLRSEAKRFAQLIYEAVAKSQDISRDNGTPRFFKTSCCTCDKLMIGALFNLYKEKKHDIISEYIITHFIDFDIQQTEETPIEQYMKTLVTTIVVKTTPDIVIGIKKIYNFYKMSNICHTELIRSYKQLESDIYPILDNVFKYNIFFEIFQNEITKLLQSPKPDNIYNAMLKSLKRNTDVRSYLVDICNFMPPHSY